MMLPGELSNPEQGFELTNRIGEAWRALRGLPPSWYRGLATKSRDLYRPRQKRRAKVQEERDHG